MVYFIISLYQQKYLHMNIQKKFLDRRTLKNNRMRSFSIFQSLRELCDLVYFAISLSTRQLQMNIQNRKAISE